MLDNIGRGSWKSETGVRAVLRLLCRDRDIVPRRKRRRNCGTSGGGQIGLDDGEAGQAGQGGPGAAAGALLDSDEAEVALGPVVGEGTARSTTKRRIMFW